MLRKLRKSTAQCRSEYIPVADCHLSTRGRLQQQHPTGLPVYLMRRLQPVHNAAARLLFDLRLSDRVFDSLISLHWLRVPERIRSPSTYRRSFTVGRRCTFDRSPTFKTQQKSSAQYSPNYTCLVTSRHVTTRQARRVVRVVT